MRMDKVKGDNVASEGDSLGLVSSDSWHYGRISANRGTMRRATDLHMHLKQYRVTHLIAEKVMLTSVPSQDKLGMSWN